MLVFSESSLGKIFAILFWRSEARSTFSDLVKMLYNLLAFYLVFYIDLPI